MNTTPLGCVVFVGDEAARHADDLRRYLSSDKVTYSCYPTLDELLKDRDLPSRLVAVFLEETQLKNPRWLTLHTIWPDTLFVVMGGYVGSVVRVAFGSPVLICGSNVDRALATWVAMTPLWLEIHSYQQQEVIDLERAKELTKMRMDCLRGRVSREVLHDVVSPVMIANNYSDIISRVIHANQTPDGSVRVGAAEVRMLESLRSQLDYAVGMLGSVREIHRGETMRPVGLRELIRDVMQTEKRAMVGEAKVINVTAEIQELAGVDYMVEGSKAQLRRMVDNLIANSIKARAENIRVMMGMAEHDHFFITVEDDGVGCPDGEIRMLLQAPPKEDAGFGIYIVRRIVQTHGGAVSYYHRKPRGLGITIKLPRLQSVKETADSRNPMLVVSAA